MMLNMHPLVAPSMLDTMLMDVLHLPGANARAFSANAPPRLSVQDDGAYVLTVSTPGVSTSDLSISVRNGSTIKIDGETRMATHSHVVHWSTSLPRDADGAQASAKYADGLLQIQIPKKTIAEPTAITVKTVAEQCEVESEYTVTFAVPGISASDLKIVAKAGALAVHGETKRTGARIAKTVRLPQDADAPRANATCIDGLLSIHIPKKSEDDVEAEVVMIPLSKEHNGDGAVVGGGAQPDWDDAGVPLAAASHSE